MPSIKDFDKKKKKHHKKSSHDVKSADHVIEDDLVAEDAVELPPQEPMSAKDTQSQKSQKRRPSQMDADVVESVGESVSVADTSSKLGDESSEESSNPETYQSFSDAPKFELNFPFSFIVKSKVPKTFDLAEKIAGDWINDGSFESLPVGHPLAQILAANALTRAKRIEKKVLNSTPVTLAKIGLEYAKSKIKR